MTGILRFWLTLQRNAKAPKRRPRISHKIHHRIIEAVNYAGSVDIKYMPSVSKERRMTLTKTVGYNHDRGQRRYAQIEKHKGERLRWADVTERHVLPLAIRYG